MALSENQDQSLSRLMKSAQDGDKASYEVLLKDVCQLLRGYLQKRLGRSEASEDVMQEILISIHSARHTYDPAKPFAPWMYAIAKFRLADYWRRTFRLIEDEMPEGLESKVAEPEASPFVEEMKDRVTVSLSRLPEKQRRAVNLLKLEGMSIREAALELQMTEAALKVTAHRAYKALRKAFEKEIEYE